jgi:hypothetical protein
VPHGQQFEAVTSDTVVNPIADSIKVQPAYIRRARFFHANSEVWLYKKEIESSLQILPYCARRCRPVDCPPLDNTFNLTNGPSRDEKLKWHS